MILFPNFLYIAYIEINMNLQKSEVTKFLFSNSIWFIYILLLITSHIYPQSFFSSRVRQITSNLVFRWALVALLLYSLWRYRTAPSSMEARHAPMLFLSVVLTEYLSYNNLNPIENFINENHVYYVKKAGSNMYLTHHNNNVILAPTQVDYTKQLWRLHNDEMNRVHIVPATHPITHPISTGNFLNVNHQLQLSSTPIQWNMEPIDNSNVEPHCIQQDQIALQSLMPGNTPQCSYMKLSNDGSYMGVNQNNMLNLIPQSNDDGQSTLFSLIKCEGNNCNIIHQHPHPISTNPPSCNGTPSTINPPLSDLTAPLQSLQQPLQNLTNTDNTNNCLEITVENFNSNQYPNIKNCPQNKAINDYQFYMPQSSDYQTDSPAGKAYQLN